MITTASLRSRVDPYGVAVVDIEDEGIAAQPGTPLPFRRPTISPMSFTPRAPRAPRRVAVGHCNVTALLASLDGRVGLGGVWSQCHSLAFDFSVWEIFGPLLSGGRVVVVADAVVRSAEELHALLVAEQVTVLSQTPSALMRCRLLMG